MREEFDKLTVQVDCALTERNASELSYLCPRSARVECGANLNEFLAGVRPDAAPAIVALSKAVHAATPLDSTIRRRPFLYGLEGDLHEADSKRIQQEDQNLLCPFNE